MEGTSISLEVDPTALIIKDIPVGKETICTQEEEISKHHKLKDQEISKDLFLIDLKVSQCREDPFKDRDSSKILEISTLYNLEDTEEDQKVADHLE